MDNYAKYILITTAHCKELTVGHSEYIILLMKLLNAIHLRVFADNMLCHGRSAAT